MIMSDLYCIKGNILYTKEFGSFDSIESGYILVQDNKIKGVYDNLPKKVFRSKSY